MTTATKETVQSTVSTSLKKQLEMVDRRDGKLALAYIYIAFIAVLLGGIAGLLQVLVRAGTLQLPSFLNYYQVLTVHGVLLGLVLTTFFIMGFQTAAVSRTSGTFTNKQRTIGWIGFWIATIGLVAAAAMILTNEASVLYTFYAPLQAHWVFYLGLALVIVGSWFTGLAQIMRFVQWKKEHKGQSTPLLSFMVVVNNFLWYVATLGVAIEVLFQLIPWSMGLVERVDVLLSRTLFWYFGHALVYFWLLPAYMIWYTIIPKIIGGKVFSDALAKLTFMLFLILSVPVGIHHQYTEPGIDPLWKFIQAVLTFFVVVPSLMTAFSMFATFELRGRELFIPGGAGGIVNASYQMNELIHNTIWVTGHFHLTVASAVALTFFGTAFWLIPHLNGRTLTKRANSMANCAGILWAIGMTIMSSAMHIAGLLGAPRRSDYSTYGGSEQAAEWLSYQIAQAVGGSILFIAILVITGLVIYVGFFAPKGEEDFPIAEVAPGAAKTPAAIENFKLWGVIMIAVIIFAYTIPIIDIIFNSPLGAKGFRLW